MRTSFAGFFIVLALACTCHPATSATHYVWQDSPSPGPPYDSWATAAHVIQDAVDAAMEGDTVLVTNGVYATGGPPDERRGRPIPGEIIEDSRVVVHPSISLRSVNGPEVTHIEGRPFGERSLRCVSLGSNAVLSGFTLFRGKTSSGGGVSCDPTAVVTNCFITANAAFIGGGACGGTIYDSVLSGNVAEQSFQLPFEIPSGLGGGASSSRLINCTLSGNVAVTGGGGNDCTFFHCALTNNSAYVTSRTSSGRGGGAAASILYNCRLTHNTALGIARSEGKGGGAYFCTLFNSIISQNEATIAYEALPGGGTKMRGVGGAYFSTNYNCTVTDNGGIGVFNGGHFNSIIYYNRQNFDDWYDALVLFNCCTIPLPPLGSNNITNEPGFLDRAGADLRLSLGSPCIDIGSDFVLGESTYLSDVITTDLAGLSRVVDGDGDGVATFDMGAHEYQARTPAEMVEILIQQVSQSNLPVNRKTALLASLRATQASFERSSLGSGINQLKAFQNKVRAQLARSDPDLAEVLINAAQLISESAIN